MDGVVRSLTVFDDGHGPALYAGGEFAFAGSIPARRIAKWDGANWSALGSGVGTTVPEDVYSLAAFDDGTGPALYAGGRFFSAGGVPAVSIARWDGASWSPLGSGIGNGGGDAVETLAVFDDGTGPALYAGGEFLIAGGVPVHNVARWNGTHWSAVGVLGATLALAVFDEGAGPRLFAGCQNYFDRLDGASWTQLGHVTSPGGYNSFVDALAVWDDGGGRALYLGGFFTAVNGHAANDIARWNGSTFATLGNGSGALSNVIEALAVFDDGSGSALYAGGELSRANGGPGDGIAKWNGSAWSPLGAGIRGAYGLVTSLAVLGNGPGSSRNHYAGGWFHVAGDSRSEYFAEWKGCSGPGELFCSGDGSPVACPCGNNGAPGHGCENSASTGGALLSSSGSTHPDTVILSASGELPTSPTVFLQADASQPPATFGDGIGCLGGHIRLLFTEHASGGIAVAPGPGDPSITARSAALGDPIVPGSVRFYETVYRDPSPTFCPPPLGSNWNSTNAVRVTW
jgi:hypothetical protein